jgi:guanylate kinase
LPPYSRRGVLFVLSGPSGVGKDALLAEAGRCESFDYNRVGRAVTATTRAPRAGEVPGVDYLFWTEAQFREKIMADAMLEWAEVYGNLYGTPRAGIEQALDGGTSVVLKIDVQGAASVRRAMPGAVLVFLAPPSLEELENRLRGRLTDSAEAIDRRLSTALHEMQNLPDYDYVVVNDDLATAADELRAIFLSEQRRVKTIQDLKTTG